MGSAGAVGLFGVSVVRNCFSRCRQSWCSSWESGSVGVAVEMLSCVSSSVSARSLSNRLAPGRTSGAGYKMMLPEVRMESVSVIRQR
jgi:hypothetical protein